MRLTVDGIHGDVWGCRGNMLLTDGWWLREAHLQLLPSFGRLCRLARSTYIDMETQ